MISHEVIVNLIAATTVSRRKALQGLQAKAYEDKLLGKIDEAFWAECNAAWQAELAEINGEPQTIENAPSKADLLAAARKPVELLQAAPSLYVTQEPAEKARLLKTMVSNYTITDGSVSVVLRSPFDVLARGAKTGKWWSIAPDYRTAVLEAYAAESPVLSP